MVGQIQPPKGYESTFVELSRLGVALKSRVLKETCKSYNVQVVFLMETRCKETKIKKIQKRLGGFSNMFVVDPVGFVGGLVIWRRDYVRLMLQKLHSYSF